MLHLTDTVYMEMIMNNTNTYIKKKSKFRLFFRNIFIKDTNEFILTGNIRYILAVLIPILIFVVLFIIRGIAPFGNRLYMPSDMYHQYTPFYSELWYKIRNGGSIFYTWNNGLGSNFLAEYAYYLSSPVNWIVALFPHNMIPVVLDWIIVAKCSMASLTMTVYLSKHFNTKSSFTAFFAVFYALSGYMAAYKWNVMWLDCIAVAPLVILGLERLVNKNKPFMFCITLSLSVLFNYYIAIILIVTLVIYFIVLLILADPKENKLKFYLSRTAKFIIYGMIAVGIACILLIPEYYAFKLSASSDSDFPNTLRFYFDFGLMFSRHISNLDTYMWTKHYPNIYCGAFVFVLIPLFAMNKEIKLKTRIVYGALLAVFLFSFMTNIPDYIWHGMHFPNSLPARQSFMYIFFMLTVMYMTIKHRRGISITHIIISASISNAFLAYVYFMYAGDTTLVDDNNYIYGRWSIIGTIILIWIYYCLLLWDKYILSKESDKSSLGVKRKRRLSMKAWFTFVISGTMVTECALNMGITGLPTLSYGGYIKNDEKMAETVSRISADNNNEFFRLEQQEPRTNNDGNWYSYHSMSIFSSSSPKGLSLLYKNMGMKSSVNSYNGLGATLFAYAFFGVQYVSSRYSDYSDPFMSKYEENENYTIYKLNSVLPIGYSIPAALAKESFVSRTTISGALLYQNDIFKKMTGIGDLFTKTDTIDYERLKTVTAERSGHYYMELSGNAPEDITITKESDVYSKTFSDLNKHNHIVDIGYLKKGESIDIDSEKEMNAEIYVMDENNLSDGIKKLNNNSVTLSRYTDTSIEGDIDSSGGSVLFTFPYDPGWTLYVDGVKTDTYEVMGSLTGADISDGKHHIFMEYKPKGLYLGLIVSLSCVSLLAAIMIIKYKNKK